MLQVTAAPVSVIKEVLQREEGGASAFRLAPVTRPAPIMVRAERPGPLPDPTPPPQPPIPAPEPKPEPEPVP
jgi:hypothetical protein